MDFGNYPPEINSARMYAGAGAGPMMVAAEAWQGAGRRTAFGGQLVSIRGLGIDRRPVVGTGVDVDELRRLRPTRRGCGPPPRRPRKPAPRPSPRPPPIRQRLRRRCRRRWSRPTAASSSTLIATNLFGRNTQAIAANEAQYGEMWAQDAAAMYGYAASSASATQLTPFNPPQQNTNPAGSADQAAAVGQATGTAAGNAQSTIQQAFSAVPAALSSAAAAPAATDPLSTISNLISIFVDLPAGLATFAADIPLGSLGVVALPFDVIGALTGTHTDKIVSGWNGEQAWPGEGPAPGQAVPCAAAEPAERQRAAAQLSAGLAEANTVGGIVGTAELDHRHTRGTPERRDSAGATGHRQRSRRGEVRFGKHAQPRWRWRGWPAGRWPALSAPASAAVGKTPKGRGRAQARTKDRLTAETDWWRRRGATDQAADRGHRSRRRAARVRQTSRRGNSDRPGIHRAEEPSAWSLKRPPPPGGYVDCRPLWRKGMRSNGFRVLSAGDKLRPDVFRSGIGADAGRCAGLGSAGRRAVYGGQRIPVGGVGADVRAWSGPSSDVDERRGRVLCRMAERHRRAG